MGVWAVISRVICGVILHVHLDGSDLVLLFLVFFWVLVDCFSGVSLLSVRDFCFLYFCWLLIYCLICLLLQLLLILCYSIKFTWIFFVCMGLFFCFCAAFGGRVRFRLGFLISMILSLFLCFGFVECMPILFLSIRVILLLGVAVMMSSLISQYGVLIFFLSSFVSYCFFVFRALGVYFVFTSCWAL